MDRLLTRADEPSRRPGADRAGAGRFLERTPPGARGGGRVLALALPLLLASAPAVAGAEDCNGNGRADGDDIATASSADCNGNGLPDDCEAVPPAAGPRSSVLLAGFPVDLLLADLSGSRARELVVITAAEGVFRLSVLGRLPGGAWETIWQLEGEAELSRVAAGDLDGDRDPDLLLVGPGGIDLHINDGGGALENARPLLSRPGLSAIELADMNRDGTLDIATTDPSTGSVLILLNDGRGHVQRTLESELPLESPAGLLAADWDADGDPDLAIPDRAGGLAFLLNEGDGALVPAAASPDLGPLRDIVSADLDRDASADLTALRGSAVVFLRNRAELEFELAHSFDGELRKQTISAFALGDLDLDADLDLALALGGGAAPEELLILENAGDGRFVATAPLTIARAPDHLVAGDVDGDGDDELLLWSGDRDRVEILYQEGAELDPPAPISLRPETLELPDSFEPHSTVLADLDGDGDLDLATMDGEDRVRILDNDGAGSLAVGPTYTLDGADELIWITSSDLDRDGDLDIAGVDEQTDVLLILQNRGDGSFRQLDERYEIGNRSTFLTAADLDGDGFEDLVCSNSADRELSVFLNRGDASFEPAVEISVGNNPEGIAAGDFDADGDVDLAVAHGDDDGVLLLFNDGEGSFAERAGYEIGPSTYIAAADIDGDGDLDLAAARESAEEIALLLNEGDGRFVAPGGLGIGQAPRSVLAIDLDGDGQAELVTGNARQDSVSVLQNLGSGRFAPARHHAVGGEPRFVVGGDVDGDGDNDIIAANHDSHDFTLLLNEPALSSHRLRICTEMDFQEVSTSRERDGIREALTRYLVPVDPASSPIPALFSNARLYSSTREFLSEVFPGSYSGLTEESYRLLAGRRESREYFAGTLFRLRIGFQIVYGFDVYFDADPDLAELPTVEELRSLHESLRAIFSLATPVYFPDRPAALEDAASWPEPGFPILLLTELFQRADVSGDGVIDISDAIALLEYLFRDGAAPGCEKVADASDDGFIDVGDPVFLLIYLFRGGVTIPAPFPGCARDPTPDSLSCDAPNC